MSLSKNLDIRSYAAARNVRLYEVAERLGISKQVFSTAYMRVEQSRATKDELKRIICEIAEEKGHGDEKKED